MAKYKLPKIEDLFNAGVHFGHQVRRWNPLMEKYIFGVRSGIHIIDLEQTHKKLEEAADALHEVAKTGGQIIFVGTKRQAKDIVQLESKRSGALFVNERWLGGTITNYRIIRKNMDTLVDLLGKKESGAFSHYTKKERLLIDRKIEKLNTLVGGIVGLQGKPAAVVVIDTKRERTAVREAKQNGIPVIGVMDTNCDPTNIDYVIPANDDAIRSIALVMKTLGDAVEAGYEDYAKAAAKDKLAREAELAAKKAKEIEEKEAKREEAKAKVTSSEAPHATEEAGKKHAKEAEKGEEEVEKAKEATKKESKKTKK